MSRSASRQIALYVVLVAITLILLAFSNSGLSLELRRGVGFALSPIQDTLRQGTRTVTSLFATIGEIERLRQQNEDLIRRSRRSRPTTSVSRAWPSQNEQLAALLEVRISFGYETVAAEVISRRTTEQERVISLDRNRRRASTWTTRSSPVAARLSAGRGGRAQFQPRPAHQRHAHERRRADRNEPRYRRRHGQR